jgi:Holliday junction resolvase RusA-like endonuclease
MKYLFNITPMGKPRMTQSDKWNERKPVMEYLAFKQELNLKANILKYKMGSKISLVFYIPMPYSWSEKKKTEMDGQVHQQKPDIDNLVKAFTDALTGDDAHIYEIHAYKYWSRKPMIEVFE